MHTNYAMPVIANAKPEVELLVCCARTYMDPARIKRAKALVQQGLDWTYLTRTKHARSMTPLLYWHLNKICPDDIPSAVFDELRNRFQIKARCNKILTEELIKILELLQAHSIPAIPFKGPVLAATLYGNLALRKFGDLDILVHKKDVLTAMELLTTLGYKSTKTNSQNKALLKSWYNLHLERYDDRLKEDIGKVKIEVHWRFRPKSIGAQVNPEPIWNRLQSVPLAGMNVYNFSPEDLLLFLCMHGAGHRWESLRLICDISELVRTYDNLDWQKLFAQAQMLYCERRLLLGLLMAKNILGTTLPEWVVEKLDYDPTVSSLAEELTQLLFQTTEQPLSFRTKLVIGTRMTERFRDKVLFVYTYSRFRLRNPLRRALIRPIRHVGRFLLKNLKR